MENSPLSLLSSTTVNVSSSLLSRNSPSIESRSNDNSNWYDDGSIKTCIDQASSQVPSIDFREISVNEILNEVDVDGVSNEFFLHSPHNTTDDEPSDSIDDDRHEQEIKQIQDSTQISNRTYTMENKNNDNEVTFFDEFHCSSTVDLFGFKPNNSSIMVTNLDDILIDDYDDENEQQHLKDSSNYLTNMNCRRPIQEDILYEVEHENSLSEHSQHTSSIAVSDDNESVKIGPISEISTTKDEPIESDVNRTATMKTLSQEKSNEVNSSLEPTVTQDHNTLPIYIPSSFPTSTEQSSTLHVDTLYSPTINKWNTSTYRYSDLFSSPSSVSYTSKIRQRHYSVGSYYDYRTTTVTLHPSHTFYLLGSAPVSPHHSPVSYGNVTLNALRRVNPFLDTITLKLNNDYRRSSSLTRNDYHRTIPFSSMKLTTSNVQTSTISVQPLSFPSSPSKDTNTTTCSQNNVSRNSPEVDLPLSPPRPSLKTSMSRPKTSRERTHIRSTSPPRVSSTEQDQTPNFYQEIDSTSSDNDKTTTLNADLQFIRGTIKRVLHHPSESSTFYEDISDDNKNDNESISLSNTSKISSNKSNQYPAVEAVQRFYHHKALCNSETKNSNRKITNLDDNSSISNHSSSSSSKLCAHLDSANVRKYNLSKSQSNSSETGQASSEEIDDTLNDIEDDYHDDKLKRQAANNSLHTSNENSPLHSSENRIKIKELSQETQTLQRQPPIKLTTQSLSDSQATIQSHQTARSYISPIDINTQMVIEHANNINDGHIGEISGDMIIYYDDIEIVEHSSNISSTESDSTSSINQSQTNSKSKKQLIESIPPPIPARTLKPAHLLNSQSQTLSISQNKPTISSSSKINRTYELEKSTTRKRFDVNSVNTMLNRTDYYVGPTVPYRHPSARHFVGKLNNDDISLRNSNVASTNISAKSLSAIVKSKTLPLQSINANGHVLNDMQSTPRKNTFSTLPIRTVSSIDTKEKHSSVIADTNALVKHIQNSLSHNTLYDSHITSPLSISTRDLRTFVSSTYSPSDENMIDDNGIVHIRQHNHSNQDFKRQARLSKSFHNVSECSGIEECSKNKNNLTSRTQPSKSVENNLNHQSQNQSRNSQMFLHFPPITASTSFSTLSSSEDNPRMLSMKWYTGQVNENSEICYNTSYIDNEDLLYTYILKYSNREIQLILERLRTSNDIRIHAALDDICSRVAQFDASKSSEDLHIFMRYLESRLRDINNKNLSSPSAASSNYANGQRQITSSATRNGYHASQQRQQSDTTSIKSRVNSIAIDANRETPSSRQFGRQHHRSSGSMTTTERRSNAHSLPPPRRTSHSGINQDLEHPAVFDNMLNAVLGLPKKEESSVSQTYSSSSRNNDKSTLLTQIPTTTNTTDLNKIRQDIGKRLFQSGTYQDPRLIYDNPQKTEKEEQLLETSV